MFYTSCDITSQKHDSEFQFMQRCSSSGLLPCMSSVFINCEGATTIHLLETQLSSHHCSPTAGQIEGQAGGEAGPLAAVIGVRDGRSTPDES